MAVLAPTFARQLKFHFARAAGRASRRDALSRLLNLSRLPRNIIHVGEFRFCHVAVFPAIHVAFSLLVK
jgi:hypothetical protein